MAVMSEPEITIGNINSQPEWITAELPARYAELAAQIAALQSEASSYEDVAGVLWQTGGELTQSVRRLFGALQFEAVPAELGSNHDLCVHVDGGRRLLVVVAGSPESIDRKAPVIARVLSTLQQDAGEHDRVVVVSNAFCDTPLTARREEPVTPEAMKLIRGLGANVVASATLFGIWRYSFKDPQGAKKSLVNLHTQEGGIFR
jgi:hypothetical protein